MPEADVSHINPEDGAHEEKKPGDVYVRAFARGLAVIKSFSREHPQQTLTEVAETSGLTRAGARRILLTLVDLGYAENEGRLFRLTPKILDLGYAYLSSMPLWDIAQPIIEELVREVKESSSIAMLDGTDIVYVLRVPTRKIMTLNLSIGSRLPAALTSMGRVLLSGLDDQALDEHLQAFLARGYPSVVPLGIESLRASIEAARKQGWAIVRQELESGLISVAAPIRGRNGRIIAAVNISSIAEGDESVERIKAFLPLLLDTAERISQNVEKCA